MVMQHIFQSLAVRLRICGWTSPVRRAGRAVATHVGGGISVRAALRPSCTQAFHAAGLVHRDLKPLNIIFAEEPRRFKLIDLGACADLRTGTN
jgi:serine/threonine protein kinase